MVKYSTFSRFINFNNNFYNVVWPSEKVHFTYMLFNEEDSGYGEVGVMGGNEM